MGLTVFIPDEEKAGYSTKAFTDSGCNRKPYLAF